MPEIFYKPKFLRLFDKLPSDLQDEVERCIELLQKNPREASLRTHKLSGKLDGRFSASVNYIYRIIFRWEKDEITLLLIGTHDIYR